MSASSAAIIFCSVRIGILADFLRFPIAKIYFSVSQQSVTAPVTEITCKPCDSCMLLFFCFFGGFFVEGGVEALG